MSAPKDDPPTSIVDRVTVLEEKVEVSVAADRLFALIHLDHASKSRSGTELLIVAMPAKLKRTRGEVQFVLPPDQAGMKSQPVPPFVKAIARAHDWASKLASGELPTARALAEETGFDRTYIGRLLP